VGPGSVAGFGGGAFKIGGGVSAPVAIVKPEPEYSEEARKPSGRARLLLELIVDANGVPQEIKVVKSLGPGPGSEGHRSGPEVALQARIEGRQAGSGLGQHRGQLSGCSNSDLQSKATLKTLLCRRVRIPAGRG
jgi:hypothetical protein